MKGESARNVGNFPETGFSCRCRPLLRDNIGVVHEPLFLGGVLGGLMGGVVGKAGDWNMGKKRSCGQKGERGIKGGLFYLSRRDDIF